MIYLIVILAVFCWTIGALLILKMDAMFCDAPTEYDVFGVMLSFCSWPIIGCLLLRTQHRVGTFAYCGGEINVLNEQWRY